MAAKFSLLEPIDDLLELASGQALHDGDLLQEGLKLLCVLGVDCLQNIVPVLLCQRGK